MIVDKNCKCFYVGPMTEENSRKYQERTETFKALAHPMRLLILDILSNESPLCVCDIQERSELNMSTLSRHLDKLKKAGFISDRREGRHIYYSLKICCLDQFICCVGDVVKGRKPLNEGECAC
jgi:DNA-binding transcriptional ArsR family regulator